MLNENYISATKNLSGATREQRDLVTLLRSGRCRRKRHTPQRGNTATGALWMDSEEAEAVLTVLMSAPPSPAVSPEVTDRLICRIASVRRSLLRATPRCGLSRRRVE